MSRGREPSREPTLSSSFGRFAEGETARDGAVVDGTVRARGVSPGSDPPGDRVGREQPVVVLDEPISTDLISLTTVAGAGLAVVATVLIDL